MISNQINKKIFIITMLLPFCVELQAQDIIIKNDKIEIESKVIEINDTSIKYKKWDNLDGPIYNISKMAVFMIVYANGQKEVIKQSVNSGVVSIQNPPNTNKTNETSKLQSQINQSNLTKIDTVLDYNNIRVKYKPTRINVGFQSPFSFGSDQEFRIVKNILNIGVSYNYTIPKNEYILESSFGFVYASLYAPVNRLSGNYQMQDTGLFVFGQGGYSATSFKYLDFNNNIKYSTSGGFSWRFGADYFFSKSFGITISTYEFKSFYGGIVISLF